MNDALRGLKRPPPGTRPAKYRATVGRVSHGRLRGCWGAPSLVVAPVAAHDGLDDAAVQFLLQQSLRGRAAEDEEARKAKELRQLEVKLATKHQQVSQQRAGSKLGDGAQWVMAP